MAEPLVEKRDTNGERLQATRKQFMAQPVEFLQNHTGEIFVSADSIGHALGYKNPTQSMSNLYRSNVEELAPHRRFTLRVNGHTTHRVTAYTEQGAYIVGMLAGTKRAKAFRLWLAKVCQELRRLHTYVSELEREIEQKKHQIELYRKLASEQASFSARSLALYGASKRRNPELHGIPTPQSFMFELLDEGGEPLQIGSSE